MLYYQVVFFIQIIDPLILYRVFNSFFIHKKLLLYQSKDDVNNEYNLIKELIAKYPENTELKPRLRVLEARKSSNRIGLNYTLKKFDRNDYGPWHTSSLQYIRERKWGSLISNINYTNRYNFGETSSGFQLELESYFFTSRKGYVYLQAAVGQFPVFPKYRFGASYYLNLKKGWETDLGLRYSYIETQEFKTLVVGAGKYINNYWVNFRTFLLKQNIDYYPVLALSTRYFLKTRFDYFGLNLGYGISPDEKNYATNYQLRINLKSYRVGGNYNKLIQKNKIIGVQLTYSNQEYAEEKFQNELDINLQFQYKF